MPVDTERFSADNLRDMAAATHTIVEVGANPYGSGVTYWARIQRHLHRKEYETTYAEDSGSMDAAWASVWVAFIRDQRKRSASASAETSDANRLLDALGVR